MIGQRPTRREPDEELTGAAANLRQAIRRAWAAARARAGGGRFLGWFKGRFGCNRCTPFLRWLHPVRAVVAPRRRCGVQWLHPIGRVMHRLGNGGATAAPRDLRGSPAGHQ
jgi:hypothetical protein